MIRLGLRLTLAGGREAAVRLVITAAAVALGVALLLSALAGINAVNAQNGRYAWLGTAAEFNHPGTAGTGATGDAGTGAHGDAGTGAPGDAGTEAHHPMWWVLTPAYVDGRLIGRVDVAATGAHPPVPPGISRVPGPGQFYASPALTRLLRDHPAGEL
ncbi:MAG TPA: hypothetical protein VH089_12910, partial [Streptosporangiaceae bacterium]|nr:hypothetical protein [Streptosporangiaceae bacterium]